MNQLNAKALWTLTIITMCAVITGCGDEDVVGSTTLEAPSIILDEEPNQTRGQPEADAGLALLETDNPPPQETDHQPAGPVGDLTCNDVYACFETCSSGDNPCYQNCFEGGTQQAQEQVEAVSECANRNECNDSVCVRSHCSAEVNACESSSAPRNEEPQPSPGNGLNPEHNRGQAPEGSPAHGLNCVEIHACFGACTEGDGDCFQTCFDDGSEEAQSQVEAVGECARRNQCAGDACVRQHCAAEVGACEADGNGRSIGNEGPDQGPAPGNAGGLDCTSIILCFNGCQPGNQACLDGCFDRGTAQGQREVDAIRQCASANQCQDSFCVETFCPGEVAQCEHPDAPGQNPGQARPPAPREPAQAQGLSCNAVYECFRACPNGEQACYDGCYNRGTQTAQEAVSGIGQCLRDNQCESDACVEANCARQINACDADGGVQVADPNAPPPNTLDCQDVFSCFQECDQGNRACLDGCYGAGTAEAQREVSAIGDCISANGCEDSECINTECEAEVALCEDRPVAPNVPVDAADEDDEHQENGDVAGEEEPEAEAEAEEPVFGAEFNRDAMDEGAQGDHEENEEAEEETLVDGLLDQPIPAGAEAAGTCEDPAFAAVGQFVGHTGDSANSHRGSCAGGGQERVFRLSPQRTGSLCIDTGGSQFDTVLYVRRNQCAVGQAELACNDDHIGVQSSVQIEVTAGESYFIFVDSYNVAGDFVLNVREGACI